LQLWTPGSGTLRTEPKADPPHPTAAGPRRHLSGGASRPRRLAQHL